MANIRVYRNQIVVITPESTDIYPFAEGWTVEEVVAEFERRGFTVTVEYQP